MFRRWVAYERPERPFTGFKLAHAVLSADDQRAGFAGLSIGARRVYGITAEASCVWNDRHVPPKRRCGCGFYCLNTLAEAKALSCATENRAAVLLEVIASGRFIRYDRGLRYSRQRVRAVQIGPCECGRAASELADSGTGFAGWRNLAPSCSVCVASRLSLPVKEFAARLDLPVAVRTGADTRMAKDTSAIAVLTAEIALIQARLDDLQERVDRYQRGAAGD